ncbi:putative RNA-binding Zn-ribbon protein involved in translation (DUF1610 family) [Caldalkalibacillus uzonensis]|uniref:RNA-binding Zn-ribbon protein involved in translation (DUF1610 family) n=1 Tax=Caldalkalibacillus uzonensis TaxID=353224 RepID=A0ABU0CWT2_9BACI|nr:hypothetical protein [Caldalkalibacillus uzonensis]MDQ0340866.1 putative RNA-binding Zn-ribbon protein involved in translation (DUF1610 family) [Caldalkalibacillus uzonensis]
MELLALLPSLILFGGCIYVLYLLLVKVVLVRRMDCQVCLYSFKSPLGKVKVTCPHCSAQYIIRKDKTVKGP